MKPLTLGDLRKLRLPDNTPIVLDYEGRKSSWDYHSAEACSQKNARPSLIPNGLWVKEDFEGYSDEFCGDVETVVLIGLIPLI